MENYGLIPLLQRKVETIIVFVNTGSPLNTNAGPDELSKGSGIDAYLPPFIGYPVQSFGTFTGHNQVFAASDFAAVTHKLQIAKKAGQPVTTTTEHTVQRNDWWGIKGGQQVQVTWCYLDRVSAWECQLAADIRDAINRENHHFLLHGTFRDFPNYMTMLENGLELVELEPEQVNLPADLTCWNIRSQAEALKSILS